MSSSLSRLPGLAVATVGLSHFVKPDAYESITKAASRTTSAVTPTSTAVSRPSSGWG